MKNTAKRRICETVPPYACTAARLAALFGVAESAIHLYAAEGMLPHLPSGRFDGVWLGNLVIGQRVMAGSQRSLSAAAMVALGWVESMGDDLESSEDRDACIAVFERNGFTRHDFFAALDEVMLFCDAPASLY